MVVTVPDIIPYVMRTMYSPLRRAKNSVFMQLEKAIIRRAAAIIAISERTKSDLVQHLGVEPEKVTVTPLGISKKFLEPLSADAVTAVRTKFRLPERFLLYVGGIDPRKNIPALIEAMSVLIHQTEWRLPLVLAGRLQGQPEYPGLMSRIRELGLEPFVITPGFVPDDDLPALYAAAELFVFPSVYEGFGLPVLQSMAAACPVLAVRASSVPEVAGDTATYVDTGTARELAQAIAHALREPGRLNPQREKGRARAAGFTWARTARGTFAVYERVAAATKRRSMPEHS
jgi:glycosyltransferase involved in cell wall biosynthesis